MELDVVSSPPITAYHISNESKKLFLDGSSGQRTNFSGGAIIGKGGMIRTERRKAHRDCVVVKQDGHAVLTIELPNGEKEEFLITLPRLKIEGIWYGSPYIELTESSCIQSSSGWNSTVSHSPILLLHLSHVYLILITSPRSVTVAVATSPEKRTPLKPLLHRLIQPQLNTPSRGNGTPHPKILKDSHSTMSLALKKR